jgi:tungstate transport system substrate-binding protein
MRLTRNSASTPQLVGTSRLAVLVRAMATSVLAVLYACTSAVGPSPLDIATTTSVQQSGLLDALLPVFRAESGIGIRVHAAGSGLALQMMARGMVDLVISHAPEAEARFLHEHPDWLYRKLAYNEFVIVGPAADPARVMAARDAPDAFRRIARSTASFVSRGDGSGTHEREELLWREAGLKPPGDRLLVSGRGMALALRHADEIQGYTLSDEATFSHLQPQLDLVIRYRGDPRLLNTYGIVDARRTVAAETFREWLTHGDGRNRIRAYRAHTRPVFWVWPENCPAERPDDEPCLSEARQHGTAALNAAR